ncbi:hypothetical protein [Streptomyces cucumeris]|uniref:hypothetical protein n=1 Tax=Streptomyces cucumeris TaxID=2962890 RepID=UPI0020C86AED|nr:hypothetical protein [Streptomyces sp. NEAU-Y11]MCP9213106.1 hypothetical protein [Streptomyces sp. NEAU-Y11]
MSPNVIIPSTEPGETRFLSVIDLHLRASLVLALAILLILIAVPLVVWPDAVPASHWWPAAPPVIVIVILLRVSHSSSIRFLRAQIS